MRGLIWFPALTFCWLSAGACFYVHDDDCMSDADCHSGRVCRDGQCLDADDAEGSSDGFGGNDSGGSSSETSTSEGSTSETSTSEGSTSATTDGDPPDDDGPSCEGIRSGSQSAAVADGPSICESEASSVTTVFGDDSLLESLDGRSCVLTDRGTDCLDAFPDKYDCGDCPFELSLTSVFYEGQSVIVGWTVTPYSCLIEGCAEYCCTSDSGTQYSSLYFLSQTPPGGVTTSSASTSASSSSATSGGCTGSCCECGFPFCDGDCAGCC